MGGGRRERSEKIRGGGVDARYLYVISRGMVPMENE